MTTMSHSNKEQHDEMINLMRGFFDDGKPQVGIFWYDYAHNTLFGVEKDDADKYIEERGAGTLHKLHKTYWAKQHFRAVNRDDRNSIFYIENNYTQIPRGHVFVRPDGSTFVAVGDWIKGMIHGQQVIDTDKVHDLIADEFNLPEDFEFVIDEHWDIGKGWSGDKF